MAEPEPMQHFGHSSFCEGFTEFSFDEENGEF